MDIRWNVSRRDVQRLRAFVQSQHHRPFVQWRIALNVKRCGIRLTRDWVWLRIVGSLLSTQQRSGPGSAVFRLMQTQPFALRYRVCRGQQALDRFAGDLLRRFGGIRRWRVVAAEIEENYLELERALWRKLLLRLSSLCDDDSPRLEREVARFVEDSLRGFGPKQARNLLQSLGLTRYEIPLDSRITKWLSDFGFPLKLSSLPLSDPGYYELVLDGLQELCHRSNTYPCVLDAAIFTSFDQAEWPENTVVY